MPVNLKSWLADALVSNYDIRPRERQPGFHASSAGKCIKQVLIKELYPEAVPPFKQTTKGIFKLGHLIDGWFKEAVGVAAYSGNLFILRDHEYVTNIGGLTIYGETDLTMIDFDSMRLHIVDCKSASAASMSMTIADNEAKRMNAMQVGTYMMSKQARLFESLGFTVSGWVVYLDKDAIQPKVFGVKPSRVNEAEQYWLDVADALERYQSVRQLPETFGDFPIAPQEPIWECGYCPLFPAPDFNYRTKKELVAAKSAHKKAVIEACKTMGVPYLDSVKEAKSESEHGVVGEGQTA